MRSRWSRAGALTVALAAVWMRAASGPQAECTVYGVVGAWHDGEHREIHFGSTLAAGASVACSSTGSLNLWFQGAPQPIRYACPGADKLTRLETIRPASSGGSWAEAARRLWETVTPRVSEEPRTYVAAVSRGFGTPELNEAVLRFELGHVDVAPALEGMPAGAYSVVFLPTSETIPDDPAMTVTWRASGTAAVRLSGAKPGLIKMALSNSDGTTASDAWVLLDGPEAYAHDRARFDSAREITAKWPGGTHAEASRAVLRAYLKALASGTVQ